VIRTESTPTIAEAGDAVTAVVETLELRDVTVVAHDLGGPAALLATSRRADRVATLVAVNCFAWKPAGPLFCGMLAVMGSGPATELDAATGWLPRLTATGFGVGRHWSGADRAVFRAGIDNSARRAWHGYFLDARFANDVYAEVDAGLRGPLSDGPLLTIFGQLNDPLRFQRRWKGLSPGAHRVTVHHGNHFPMCDDPELVAAAVKVHVRAAV